MFEIHHGEIPIGQLVLHSCDNPACVNPAHLSLGSNQENHSQKAQRGRGRKNSLGLPSNIRPHGRKFVVRVQRKNQLHYLGLVPTVAEAVKLLEEFHQP